MLKFDFRGVWNQEYADKIAKYTDDEVVKEFESTKKRQDEVSDESLVYRICTDRLVVIQAELRKRNNK